MERASGSVSEICSSDAASIWLSRTFRRAISSLSLLIFSFSRVNPRRDRFTWFLTVRAVELVQIARYTLLDLLLPSLHLGLGKVPIPIVDRFEFRAIDGDTRRREQADLAAELDKLRTHLADRFAIVLPEIGDRLMIRRQPPQQPHHLDIA